MRTKTMRTWLATLCAITLLSAPVASAGASNPERSRISELEARLAKLESALSASSPAAPAAVASVNPALVHAAASVAPLGLIRPFLGYAGVPILGARISGGGGAVTSASMIDPYVPVDGTMDVTGKIRLTDTLTAVGTVFVTYSPGGTAIGSTSYDSTSLYFGTNTLRSAELRGGISDGASAVATRITANADYTTSGAKILSIGDNAGTAYAEKLYVDKDGALVSSAVNTLTGGGRFGNLYVGHSGVNAYSVQEFTAGGGITYSTTKITVAPVSTYGVDLETTGSKVTCSSTHGGSLFYENTASDSTVAKLFLCGEKADNTWAWGEVTIVFP